MTIFRIERNDPCPCGSKRKYKKCCLGRVDEYSRILYRTVAPEVTTVIGKQVLDVLAHVCGVTFKEEEPSADIGVDMERLGRLLSEAWKEQAVFRAKGEHDIKAVTKQLIGLLRGKDHLLDIRVPGDLLRELREECQAKGEPEKISLERIPHILANDISFLARSLYITGVSLRNEEYSDSELKTLLLGVSFLVRPDYRIIFTQAVTMATSADVAEGMEKMTALITPGGDEKYLEKELEFWNYVRRHPCYGEYLYDQVMQEAQPLIEALKKQTIKLVPPFYAVCRGFYTMMARLLERLPEIAVEEKIQDIDLTSELVGECLWDHGEVLYFTSALMDLIEEQIENSEDTDTIRGLEYLAIALKASLSLDKAGLFNVLYLVCLMCFLNSIPGTLRGTDIRVDDINDLWDPKLTARYAESLKKLGDADAAEYVFEQLQLWQPELSKHSAALIDRLNQLVKG